MSALALVPPRTLAHVLLDLDAATRRRNVFDIRLRENGADEDAERGWGLADDDLWALRDEAKQLIEAATGVKWASIEAANL